MTGSNETIQTATTEPGTELRPQNAQLRLPKKLQKIASHNERQATKKKKSTPKVGKGQKLLMVSDSRMQTRTTVKGEAQTTTKIPIVSRIMASCGASFSVRRLVAVER